MAIIEAAYSIEQESFIGRLRQSTGLLFDLPTEAQWEYACRGGSQTAFNNYTECSFAEKDDTRKDEKLESLAWYGGNWNWKGEESGENREVGLKKPNDWGLYDMHGQVWEFCLDWYAPYSGETLDPVGAAEGTRRVVRGGSWHAWSALCRSANRHFERGKFLGQGFRIVCDISEIEPSVEYMVIDLSNGGSKYAINYIEQVPDDILTNCQYKSTLLILRRIPAGTFLMGSSENEVGREDDEQQHSVTISRDYFMGVFLITQKQWEIIMGYNPSSKKNDSYPVETISWDDVRGGSWPVTAVARNNDNNRISLCSTLATKTGLIFDLPTEAQWEYACRAGSTSAYNNNTECTKDERESTVIEPNLDEIGWYGGNWNWELESKGIKREVGIKKPNAWGLFDMHGNLWEYCLDWYGAYDSETVDPKGAISGEKRVCRGGNWHAWAAVCRSAKRQKVRGAFGGQGVRIICKAENIDPKNLYMVVDISNGVKADKYQVTYFAQEPPDLLTNDEYKTTKVVFRHIPAGKFLMGSPICEIGRENDEIEHVVTITKDYYMGVFEYTQKQWELVMGYNNSISKWDKLPVENITWEECRSGNWP